MDLLGRVAIIVIILIVIAGIAALIKGGVFSVSGKLTEQQAEMTVISDLQSTGPSLVKLVNVSPSKLQENSWSMILGVAYNTTKACPTLIIEQYDYPATGLVPSIDNIYTQNCVVYGLENTSAYTVLSPIIVQAKAYGTNPIFKDYVTAFGYNSTVVNTNYYTALGPNDTPLGKSFSDVWIVNYSAPQTVWSQYALLDQNGGYIANYSVKR